jgi:Mannosyltransferase (PIG-V)
MTPAVAEAAVLDRPLAAEVTAPPRPEPATDAPRSRRSQLIDELALVWRPFVVSRLLVVAVGAIAMLLLGVAAAQWSFDPYNVTISFGRVGNLLAASSVRWDSVHYLQIAEHGYQNFHEVAFFPLYPLLIRLVSFFTGSFAVAGILISLGAMLATLVIVRRLTVLELGERSADLTVRLISFGPMALLLSAVYTESLFLALSVGTFYAARRGRWAIAGILGCLASAERVGGAVLLAPVLIMFFWGPRTDLAPRETTARWRPRYRPTASLLWCLLIPAGAWVVNFYFMSRGFGAGANVRAQDAYQHHEIVLPVVGLWEGLVAGWHQLELVFTGTPLTNHPSQALFQLVALFVSLFALVGVFRRLPLAYGAYTALGLLALHLSTPVTGDPLQGFARYASLRFPLFMFAAAWAIDRRRSRTLMIAFVLLLILFTAQFASWHEVATPVL